jgi:hypothetical protein
MIYGEQDPSADPSMEGLFAALLANQVYTLKVVLIQLLRSASDSKFLDFVTSAKKGKG